MDQQTNKQDPRSTEGGQVKVGDEVWVRATVADARGERVQFLFGGNWTLWLPASDCRPVEPPVIKDCLTTESNSPKILNGSSEPLAPSPCMDGVNVDQFIEGVMEARGRTSDPINPSHYKHLPAEAIDIIEAAIAGAPSNKAAFLQGQVIKYLLRCWSKKGIEDLRKAKWYLDRLVSGFDDLLVEASGENNGPAGKRYREPTLADLANGPIACEYRDCDDEQWRSGLLVHILNGVIPFLCVNEQQELSGQWGQCRIKASE